MCHNQIILKSCVHILILYRKFKTLSNIQILCETDFKNRNSIRFVIDGGRGGSSTRKKADEAEASARPQEVVLEDVTSKSAAVVIASSSTPPVPVHRLNLQQSRTNQVRSQRSGPWEVGAKGSIGPPDFGRSIHALPTRGRGRLWPPNYHSPRGYSDLPTALKIMIMIELCHRISCVCVRTHTPAHRTPH